MASLFDKMGLRFPHPPLAPQPMYAVTLKFRQLFPGEWIRNDASGLSLDAFDVDILSSLWMVASAREEGTEEGIYPEGAMSMGESFLELLDVILEEHMEGETLAPWLSSPMKIIPRMIRRLEELEEKGLVRHYIGRPKGAGLINLPGLIAEMILSGDPTDIYQDVAEPKAWGTVWVGLVAIKD